MPFLKSIRQSYNQRKIESAKRNGLRHAIFSPKGKRLFKGHYIGEWKNDKKEGKGNELDRNGCMYEGTWLDNKKHGNGISSKVLKDGTAYLVYVGEWMCGKKHGFGYHWYENGSHYAGDFWKNKRQGYGCIWYCNGDYYEGTWKNDLYNGTGMFIKANSNRYEGQFAEGKKEGYGTFYHIVTGQVQRGIWKSDSCINGTMSDVYWRQSAPRPTPYPIPRNELVELNEELNVGETEVTQEIIDDNQVEETVIYERNCKKPPKRIIADICMLRNTCPCLDTIL